MVQAIEVHELAVGRVGHHRQFVPCVRPHHLLEWLAGPVQPVGKGARGDDSLNQFMISQQLHLRPTHLIG